MLRYFHVLVRAAFTFAIIAAASSPAAAGGSVIHVPGDYPAIQQAIEAAVDGDEILVAPGTYLEAIDFLGKAILVASSDGVAVTTIDASPQQPTSVVSFASGETQDAILDGFTITGGSGTPAPRTMHGGGILIFGAHPTIRNCVITGNSAEFGGGLSVRVESSALVENCAFIDNDADFGGGAQVSLGSAATFISCDFDNNAATIGGGLGTNSAATITLLECQFSNNTAAIGGAGSLDASAMIGNCAFESNLATSPVSNGGALHLTGGANIYNTSFIGNASERDGGAIFHAAGFLGIDGCTFTNNTATEDGGAVHSVGPSTVQSSQFAGNSAVLGGAVFGSGMLVMNSEFAENSSNQGGSGIYNAAPGALTVTGCTFTGNTSPFGTGGAIRSHSEAFITQSQFIANSAEAGGAIRNHNGTLVLSHSTIAENIAFSGGGISTAPTASTGLEDVLFCGNMVNHTAGRWADLGENMFLDECELPKIPGDLDGDGSVGVPDLLMLLAAWGDCEDCAPEECPADLDGDCAVGVSDLLILLANWG